MAHMRGGTFTILFSDLVGSTELLQRLGDEAADVARRTHFNLLRKAVTALGGHEVKSLGDGLMVVFASAVDALDCAIAMQQSVHRHNQQEQQPERRLEVRIGLDVGEPIQDEGDYLGTPVVIAKRLCDKAQGGQILGSELVRRLVGSRGAYSFRDLGRIKLKGIAGAVAAYEVLWAAGANEPWPARLSAEELEVEQPARLPLPTLIAPGRLTTFVGRGSEMEKLRLCWGRGRAGQRQLVLLAGQPGIGKTRLAAEFALAAHAEGATVLFGRSYEEALIAYEPFVQALRPLLVRSPLDELPSSLGAGLEAVAKLVPELAQQLPRSPEPALAERDDERYRLFEAVSSLLTRASRTSPVVLVLDDLHWADKATLLLLKYILRSPEQSRLLVLGLYRDTQLSRKHPLAETLADLRRDHLFERIPLEGLPEADVASLVDNMVGPGSHPSLAQAIYRRTEGNPFFIEEVLLHLTQTGDIRRASDHRTADQVIDQMGIPEGVREVIGGRLSQLSEDCNEVLTIASVIGREFAVEILKPLSGLPNERLLEVLEESVVARIVDEVPQPVGCYSFSHALIRETLYEELTSTRRARLHSRIAEALEKLHRTNLTPHLAAIAYHFFEAGQMGDLGKAADYAWRAGEQAAALPAYEEAAQHYERALEATELLGSVDEPRACDLLLALGDVRSRAGERDRAVAALEQAANIARKLGDPVRLARAALGFPAGTVVDEARVGLLEEAIGALGKQDSTLLARLLGDLARALHFSDSFERGASLSRQSVEMARRTGDPATLAYALYGRHFALAGPDNTLDRLAITTEIVELAESVGDRHLALTAHTWRIADLLEMGDAHEASAEIARCTRLAAECGQPFHQWRITRIRAMLLLLQGQFEEAERLARQALVIGQQIREPYAEQDFAVQIGTVRREQGRFQEMESSVKALAEQYPQIPGWRCALTLLYGELGREADARMEFEHLAADDFNDLPRDLLWLVSATLLCEACALLGDARRAALLQRLLRPCAERCVVIGDAVACYGSASRYLGLLAATMSQWGEAADHFERALKMNEKVGARPLLAHTQCEYAQMLLAMSTPDDDEAAVGARSERAYQLLDSAITTFRELRMEVHAARAEELRRSFGRRPA
jgi:class 3 adenylate cyclase/tetratricopeptide (TPR) repeat protein